MPPMIASDDRPDYEGDQEDHDDYAEYLPAAAAHELVAAPEGVENARALDDDHRDDDRPDGEQEEAGDDQQDEPDRDADSRQDADGDQRRDERRRPS